MKAEIISNQIKNNCEIEISGYKHSFVATICAALLCNLEVKVENVPEIKEKHIFCKIFEIIGKKYKSELNTITLYPSTINQACIPNAISEEVHGTMYLIPVLLYLNKSINIFESGGCRIGSSDNKSTRPLNHVLEVMEKFGAIYNCDNMTLEEYHGISIDIMDYSSSEIDLRGPLVSGATKTAILCSLGAKEPTIILNPYMKADVMELLIFIRKIGYKVNLTGNKLTIEKGNDQVLCVNYSLASDVTEIISYIACAIYYGIKITLRNITTEFVKTALTPEFECLYKMGIHLKFQNNSIIINPVKKINSINIEVTGETIYSDSQPFYALMLMKAKGTSVISDYVWDNRMEYAKEMKKSGADFDILNNVLIIKQNSNVMLPRTLYAKDLRGAAVLVLFGAQTVGTIINGCEHIERGYEGFWTKLNKLGIKVKLYE